MLGLALGLCAALAAFVLRDAVWLQPTPYGALTLSADVPASTQLGDFELLVSGGSDRPRVVLRHASGREVFASLPGRAFVVAAHNDDVFSESRGMVRVRSTTRLRCTKQTLKRLIREEHRVVLEGELSCSKGTLPWRMQFEAAREPGAEKAVAFALRLLPATGSALVDVRTVALVAASSADEGHYGFGEQFTYFNQKGRRLPIVASEQGVGRGLQPITLGADVTAGGAGGSWHTSYAGVPHFVTSALRGLLLSTHDYAVFDMRRDEATVIELRASPQGEPAMHGWFLTGESPLDLITTTTALTGRMRRLPDWIGKGAIIGLQGGTQVVREAVAQLQAERVPVSALWLQDWVGQRTTSFGKQLWWNWTLDQKRYPEWQKLVADLRAQGIRVMTYVNPFLVDVEERKTEQGAAYRNLFAEARERGYLVKRQDGSPYLILNTSFSAGLLDLTNPSAYAWMKQVLRSEVIAAGALGWMADFGEAFPFDAVTHQAVDAVAHHNAYPELWAKLNREAIEEAGLGDEATFFSRSGYTQSPRYSTLFWLGDQLVTWDAHDGIKTAVTGLLSSGLSGFSFNHSDIGGYTTINSPIANYHRSKELHMRWAELSAFTAVFRTHQGNRPHENWQYNSDRQTLLHFARMARLYACLGPYRQALMREASEKGWPLVRHPWLHYPDEPAFRDLDHSQILLGSDLLFAPVLDAGRTQVDVVLPDATWIDARSGQALGRGHHRIAAPLGQPAVFVRGDRPTAPMLRACIAETDKAL